MALNSNKEYEDQKQYQATAPMQAIQRRLRAFQKPVGPQANIEQPVPVVNQAAAPSVEPPTTYNPSASVGYGYSSSGAPEYPGGGSGYESEFITQQYSPAVARRLGLDLSQGQMIDNGTGGQYWQRTIPNPALQPGYRPPQQQSQSLDQALNRAFSLAGWR